MSEFLISVSSVVAVSVVIALSQKTGAFARRRGKVPRYLLSTAPAGPGGRGTVRKLVQMPDR